ncbi:MAG: PEP-CTERM sorting domain-containing protein [Cyanobacteria bacterium P01_H01_bin.130]
MKLSTVAALTTAIATTTISTLAIAPTAQAGTLITNTAGQVTDIEDLFIDGYGTYNVTFVSGRYTDNFNLSLDPGTIGSDGRMGPTFWGDETGALAATQTIIDLLGDTLAIAESTLPGGAPSDSFAIAYGIQDLRFGSALLLFADAASPSEDTITQPAIPPFFGIGQGSNANLSWAKFTLIDSGNTSDPTPVPEPTALLGLGLAVGLGTLTRRKQPQ